MASPHEQPCRRRVRFHRERPRSTGAIGREPRTPIAAVPGAKVDYEYAALVQQAVTLEVERELIGIAPEVGIHFNVHVRIGKPADEILALAREIGADLVIVGSKGLTGIERFVVGSVSEKVVREAGCTVEVARPKHYEHVELLAMTEVEPHHTYVPPHRYYYEDRRLALRPVDWPIP